MLTTESAALPEQSELSAGQAAACSEPATRQLRVLQVHNFYQETGGEDIVVQHEAALLRQAGVALETWYLHSADIKPPQSLWQKLRLAWQQCWNPATVRLLQQRLAEQSVDVLHVHNVFPLFSPAIFHAAQRLGIPVVWTVHNFRWCHPAACIRDISDVRHSLWSYTGKALYRQSRLLTLLQLLTIAVHRLLGSYQRCNLLICPSEFVRQAVLTSGFSAEKLWLKPHSTALRPQNAGEKPGQSKDLLPNLLFVGRADFNKGLGFLLSALQQHQELNTFPLKVAGVSKAQAQQMFGLQLAQQAEFLGFVGADELAQLYREAQLVLVPSLVAETFGNVVIEAFSQGTPCLVSDLGALPELVLPRHNTETAAGAVFRAGDSTDFLIKLQALVTQPALLRQMADGAFERYQQYYQPKINQQALLACYQDVIRRQGK